MSELKRGWGWPSNAHKCHYFNADIISLCGKWMYRGELEESDGSSSPDDCVVCTRKLAVLEDVR